MKIGMAEDLIQVQGVVYSRTLRQEVARHNSKLKEASEEASGAGAWEGRGPIDHGRSPGAVRLRRERWPLGGVLARVV